MAVVAFDGERRQGAYSRLPPWRRPQPRRHIPPVGPGSPGPAAVPSADHGQSQSRTPRALSIATPAEAVERGAGPRDGLEAGLRSLAALIAQAFEVCSACASSSIHSSGEEPPRVWPFAQGRVRGQVIEPLHAAAPEPVEDWPELGEPLALVDGLRAGDARVRKAAGGLFSGSLRSQVEIVAR